MLHTGAGAVTLYDGICDLSKKLETLEGTMSHDDKWVISSSRRHMLVSFNTNEVFSRKGFLAQIHYGNK